MRIALARFVLTASVGVSSIGAFTAPNDSICAKPWAIPDKWTDNHDQTPPIDQIWTPDDKFETVDAQGNPLPDADGYVAPTIGDPGTGFTVLNDVGTYLILKAGDPTLGMKPGWFFPVAIGTAGNGGNAYRIAIGTCDPIAISVGDVLPRLSGNLHGPTVQGVADLVSLDPLATFDPDTNTLQDSCAQAPVPCGQISPRVGAIAVFDPHLFQQTLSNPGGPQIRVTNLFGVFIDGIVNGSVRGYLVTVPGSQS
jgi:hypothetical protein